MGHEVEVTIAAPADLVWRTISDVDNWPKWTPTMTSVRRVDDGDLRVGSSADVVQPGQRDRTWTVTELVPDTSFVWAARDPGLRLTADHVVTGDPAGPVTVRLTFDVAGPLAPIVGIVAGRTIRRAIATEAASLKKWCESVR
jgi:uncharacterized membrane protein